MRAVPSIVVQRWSNASPERRGHWLALGAAALALAVYVATLAPGLTFEHNGTDGGDLIAAARTLGIPHPTGYPIYTLLARLFTLLPIGVIAYRVNLLSAVCAAAAVGLLCRTAQLFWTGATHRNLLSTATALALAFCSLLWSQATISEVYALLLLFATLLLSLLVRWRNSGGDGLLWLAGFLLGLGLGNHLTLIFVGPAAALLLWPERHRWLRARVLLPAAGLFAVGLSIYTYLPLAAARDPAINWGNPQTWRQFLWVVTAKQYQSFAFGLPIEAIPARLSNWAWLFGDQFGWWGLILVLVGAWAWWQRDRRFLLFGLAWLLPLGLYTFFYDTGDSKVYLVPAMLLLALWWGEGVGYLLRLVQAWHPSWQRVILLLIFLLPFVSLALHWQAADLSDDWTAHAYIYQALEGLEPGSLIVVRGDRPTFALWYALYAEEQRPDLAVVSGPLLAYIWYRDHVHHLYPQLAIPEPAMTDTTIDDLVHDLVVQNLAARPIYATDPSEPWRAWFDFVQEDHPIYRVTLRGE
jgi:hypothetical protein